MSVEYLELLLEIKQQLLEYDRKLVEFDVKFTSHATQEEENKRRLQELFSQLVLLKKLVTEDNGQPSIISKLNKLAAEITETRDDTRENKEGIKQLVDALLRQQPSGTAIMELKKARWLAVAKIAGLVALAAPGIAAFFHLI